MAYFYVIAPRRLDRMLMKKKVILKRLAGEKNLKAYFPLDEHSDFPISQAISDFRSAAFVLADLSFERPSCYYELGLAQAIGKPTCLIAMKGTQIHQAYGRVHFYEDLNDYERIVKNLLDKMLSSSKSCS